MRYPTGNNGYETFLLPLLEGTHIVYNKRCVEINLDKKYVIFQDGSCCYYDNIISSIPLPELVGCLHDVPRKVKELSQELKASSISLVSVGFNKPDIARWLWFYIYDEDILAARVNSPSVKSNENAPKGCCSLQFEIYHNTADSIDKEIIIENTRYAINKMDLCKDEDILFMDYRFLPYGNVIFYQKMEEKRDGIKKYLKEHGVILIGRFGEWDYLWSDQSFLSGWNAGNTINDA